MWHSAYRSTSMCILIDVQICVHYLYFFPYTFPMWDFNMLILRRPTLFLQSMHSRHCKCINIPICLKENAWEMGRFHCYCAKLCRLFCRQTTMLRGPCEIIVIMFDAFDTPLDIYLGNLNMSGEGANQVHERFFFDLNPLTFKIDLLFRKNQWKNEAQLKVCNANWKFWEFSRCPLNLRSSYFREPVWIGTWIGFRGFKFGFPLKTLFMCVIEDSFPISRWSDKCCWCWIKELNPRRRVYVEIPKPARVELNASGFDVILATPERVLVSQHRPDAEGLISILKCLKLIIFQSFYCTFSAI
jgi:hypothetical protein